MLKEARDWRKVPYVFIDAGERKTAVCKAVLLILLAKYTSDIERRFGMQQGANPSVAMCFRRPHSAIQLLVHLELLTDLEVVPSALLCTAVV